MHSSAHTMIVLALALIFAYQILSALPLQMVEQGYKGRMKRRHPSSRKYSQDRSFILGNLFSCDGEDDVVSVLDEFWEGSSSVKSQFQKYNYLISDGNNGHLPEEHP
jgi:hypothetical protein